jgi:hypothetical protein
MDFGFMLDLEYADFHKSLESDRAPPKAVATSQSPVTSCSIEICPRETKSGWKTTRFSQAKHGNFSTFQGTDIVKLRMFMFKK